VETRDGQVKYDNVTLSAQALRGFWLAHGDILRSVKIRDLKIMDKYKDHLAAFKLAWTQTKSVTGRDKFSFIKMRRIIEDEDNNLIEDGKDEKMIANFDYEKMKVETLEELITFGIAFRDLAGSVVMDLIDELRDLNLGECSALACFLLSRSSLHSSRYQSATRCWSLWTT